LAALADAVHKTKGAAALLGQEQLLKLLTPLDHAALSGEIPDLDHRVLQIQKITKESRAAFKVAVANANL
jgi:hypothetical protein